MELPVGVVDEVAEGHPYPRAFVTVSGAHLYADAPGPERLDADVAALTLRLEQERDRSPLPEEPGARRVLHDLVVRTRLGGSAPRR